MPHDLLGERVRECVDVAAGRQFIDLADSFRIWMLGYGTVPRLDT